MQLHMLFPFWHGGGKFPTIKRNVPDPVYMSSSTTSAANMAAFLHSLGGTLRHRRTTMTSKDPVALHTTDGQAGRLPDVNKHSDILPSKATSHCCGQCCLTCVMLADVACGGGGGGCCLVVLMYGGPSCDLLNGCGERVRVFDHSAAPLLIKGKCQNRLLGDGVSEDLHLKQS